MFLNLSYSPLFLDCPFSGLTPITGKHGHGHEKTDIKGF
jgi:hypothetical protein